MKYENKSYKQTGLEQRIDNIPCLSPGENFFFGRIKNHYQRNYFTRYFISNCYKKGYDKRQEVNTTISKYNNNVFLKYKRKEIADKTYIS